jgi:tRNA (Guanine-1)-methyltransferase
MSKVDATTTVLLSSSDDLMQSHKTNSICETNQSIESTIIVNDTKKNCDAPNIDGTNVVVTDTMISSSSSTITTNNNNNIIMLSKNQRKKIIKDQRRVDKKRLKKLQDKERRMALAVEQGRDWDKERTMELERRLAGDSRHRQRKEMIWETEKQPYLQKSFQIAIDCAWGCIDDVSDIAGHICSSSSQHGYHNDNNQKESTLVIQSPQQKMTLKEIKSLSNQIRLCYSSNKRHPNPLLLTITGIRPNSTLQSMLQMEAGYDDWYRRACICTSQSLEEYDFTSTLSSTKPMSANTAVSGDGSGSYNNTTTMTLIYLTSDAEGCVSDDINDHLNNPNVVYVIGGIVDRNRFPKAAFHRAQELQRRFNIEKSCHNDTNTTTSTDNVAKSKIHVVVRTAKLPLKDYLASMPSTPILTCLHVLNILQEYKICQDWKVAFQKVLPIRKGAQFI